MSRKIDSRPPYSTYGFIKQYAVEVDKNHLHVMDQNHYWFNCSEERKQKADVRDEGLVSCIIRSFLISACTLSDRDSLPDILSLTADSNR